VFNFECNNEETPYFADGKLWTYSYLIFKHIWSLLGNTEAYLRRELFSRHAFIYRYLLTTLDRNLVKPQDIKAVLAGVAVNPDGQLLAWRHLKAHWHYLQSLFGNSTYTMGTFISAVTSHFTTEYDYQEVQTVFSSFLVWILPLSYFWPSTCASSSSLGLLKRVHMEHRMCQCTLCFCT